jgi:exodeoxyribonuclease VII large subunit
MIDGTEVRIRGRISWFSPRGQLQLSMSAIDPAYTLGQLAVARGEIVQRLTDDGLLDRNSRLGLPLVPLRIGLITSEGSAAAADFLDQLRRSGIRFDVVVADVRVQGLEAPSAVVAALEGFAANPPDVVAIIRGGGSRTDLATFDDERIARAIAWMPVPVLTGIGHEIDRSIADEVAHTSTKTPTACAQVLIEAVRAYLDRLEGTWRALASTAARAVAGHEQRLHVHAQRAARSAGHALRAADDRVERSSVDLRRRSDGRLMAAGARLERAAGQVEGSARSHLRAGDVALAVATERLGGRAQRATVPGQRRLDDLAAQLRALDPARTLARGWSITRTAGGTVVRSPGDVTAGDGLVTTVAGGEVRSTVDPDG